MSEYTACIAEQPVINGYYCPVCNKNKVKKCARCKYISYCSIECQSADWPQHKLACNGDIEQLIVLNGARSMIAIKNIKFAEMIYLLQSRCPPGHCINIMIEQECPEKNRYKSLIENVTEEMFNNDDFIFVNISVIKYDHPLILDTTGNAEVRARKISKNSMTIFTFMLGGRLRLVSEFGPIAYSCAKEHEIDLVELFFDKLPFLLIAVSPNNCGVLF